MFWLCLHLYDGLWEPGNCCHIIYDISVIIRSHEVSRQRDWVIKWSIALRFDKRLNNSGADTRVKYRTDRRFVNAYLLWDFLSDIETATGIGLCQASEIIEKKWGMYVSIKYSPFTQSTPRPLLLNVYAPTDWCPGILLTNRGFYVPVIHNPFGRTIILCSEQRVCYTTAVDFAKSHQSDIYYWKYMMTSWHENAFRINGLFWGECTGHRWITLTKSQWCRSSMFCLLLSRRRLSWV